MMYLILCPSVCAIHSWHGSGWFFSVRYGFWQSRKLSASVELQTARSILHRYSEDIAVTVQLGIRFGRLMWFLCDDVMIIDGSNGLSDVL